MLQKFFIWILKITGWKLTGQLPVEKKFVMIVAPHTSNWDLLVGLMAMFAVGGRFNFLAKRQIFFFPFSLVLRGLGGYPVDRSKSHALVDQVVDIFNTRDEFVLAITPEGTRSPVKRWKTGFYRIAEKAGIPIGMVGFDYKKKEIVLRKAFWPTGDIEKDFQDIFAFYSQMQGKYPQPLPEPPTE